ncbi:MAG TPA: PAS domain S-box protein [Candidatus Thermoplasmatota archaeon]|nr:PAS domain S-box protein [Candidatus Thermoplasmatota archaeon]
MGDRRFEHPYEAIRDASNRNEAIRGLPDEEAVGALAAAALAGDRYTANVLATEVANRLRRTGAIVETALEGLVAVDEAGNTLYLNPAAEDALGWSLSDLAGSAFHDAIHPDGERSGSCPLDTALTGGQVLRVEDDVFLRGDGHRFPVTYTAAPILREGEAVGAVLVFRDITARKAAEAALEESRRFLQGTLDGLSAQIAILESDGTILAVNEAWRRFAEENGSTGNDSVGTNYLGVCDGASGAFTEEAPTAAAGIRAVLEGRQDHFYLEYPCHGPTEQRWFILRATRFPGDGPPRCVVAHENITARRLAEDALKATLEELRSVTDR